MSFKGPWRLRISLIWLLGLTATITFVLAGTLLFFFRLPQITEETRAELRIESEDLAQQTEAMLGSLQTQLELIATTLFIAPDIEIQSVLRRAVSVGGFSAIYQINDDGKVVRAALSPKIGKSRQDELIGNDLSGDRLFIQVNDSHQTQWSDKYLSPVTNIITVGVGISSGRTVIIGEIPLDFILRMTQAASAKSNRALWIFDQRGEILADSQDASRIGVFSLANQPVFNQALKYKKTHGVLSFEGKTYDTATAYSELLNWYFLTRTPSGLSNPRVVSALELFMTAIAVSAFLSLLLAPLWASRMVRPLSDITKRARSIAEGTPVKSWPHSNTVELNELSNNLERMALAIHEREQELEAIFNASPVGIGVLEPANNHTFIKLNETLVELIGYSREELLGKNGLDLNLWINPERRKQLYYTLEKTHFAEIEGWLRRKDGNQILAAISARTVGIEGHPRTIWVVTDITDMRRIEGEIRQLNTKLEARVGQRTEELRLANDELSSTIERLQIAQYELVRSEKLASLGSLVAGVAHELNTPIGNGVMAVSTLRSALKTFRKNSAEGMKRSVLESFIESVDTGSDIALRNLERGAELISGFKQVAVDQTSSQRRGFLLDEMIHEITITLRPTIKKSVAQLRLDIPEGIRMESYPGPLGQVLTNLIANASFHAFTGRHAGLITISAIPLNNDQVSLRVEDNGIGISPELLPRIFDPFVTTKMGRGGTGLGLHIAHNITAQVLGGIITVTSKLDEGCRFELTLPLNAPLLRSTPE